jgi:hypothetical protein
VFVTVVNEGGECCQPVYVAILIEDAACCYSSKISVCVSILTEDCEHCCSSRSHLCVCNPS